AQFLGVEADVGVLRLEGAIEGRVLSHQRLIGLGVQSAFSPVDAVGNPLHLVKDRCGVTAKDGAGIADDLCDLVDERPINSDVAGARGDAVEHVAESVLRSLYYWPRNPVGRLSELIGNSAVESRLLFGRMLAHAREW